MDFEADPQPAEGTPGTITFSMFPAGASGADRQRRRLTVRQDAVPVALQPAWDGARSVADLAAASYRQGVDFVTDLN